MSKIAFGESILADLMSVGAAPKRTHHSPSAIPQIEHQITHEPDITVLNINGCSKSPDILGYIVAEDDRPHGTLAGSRFAHEQHLALFLALGESRTHFDGCELAIVRSHFRKCRFE